MLSTRFFTKTLSSLHQLKATCIPQYVRFSHKSLFSTVQLRVRRRTILTGALLLSGIAGGLSICLSQLEEPQPREMMLFSGSSHPRLSREIAAYLGIDLGVAQLQQFKDGEISIRIKESIRGKDIFIVQPVCSPVNDSLMELLLLISTFKRGSANTITAVIPYYGYARSDRKMCSRVPISAADVAIMLETMGVDRVIAVDLHSGQIQGFFSPRVPVDNLLSGIVGSMYFAKKNLVNPVIVSPDAGGVANAQKFRDVLIQKGFSNAELAMVVEQRSQDSLNRLLASEEIEDIHLVGEVNGSDCIIVEDIIDTASSICRVNDELMKHGARRVFVFAVHGIFSDKAKERVANSSITELVVTDTIPLAPDVKALPIVTQLSIAPLLAETIKCVSENRSVSSLFSVLSYNDILTKKKK